MSEEGVPILPKVVSSVKTHARNLIVWSSFLAVALVVFLFFSSGDFSFLLARPLLSPCPLTCTPRRCPRC